MVFRKDVFHETYTCLYSLIQNYGMKATAPRRGSRNAAAAAAAAAGNSRRGSRGDDAAAAAVAAAAGKGRKSGGILDAAGGGGNVFYCRLRLYNGLKQGRFSVKDRKTVYNPFRYYCFY